MLFSSHNSFSYSLFGMLSHDTKNKTFQKMFKSHDEHKYPFFLKLIKILKFLLFSVTKSCPTLCDSRDCSTRSQVSMSTISWSLLKLISTESVMPSNHLILCCPLLLLPSIFPSIRVFSNEMALRIRWPKYWSFFGFSISPSDEYSGLIFFRIDWFDLLAV